MPGSNRPTLGEPTYATSPPVETEQEQPANIDYPWPPQPATEPTPRPINWDSVSSDDLEIELLDLNRWVNWLRRTYGLPATIIPPYWHRHPELLWELSALHLHWQSAYHPDQQASAPNGWHRDFADTRERLRDWTTTSGTRLDTDRPTRQTLWPGEQPEAPQHAAAVVTDRSEDFAHFVIDRVESRQVRDVESDGGGNGR